MIHGVVAHGDAKKLSSSPPPSTSTARGSTPDENDVIPLLRAHVSKYATRDDWRGAQVSAVTFLYFVLTALAP